MARRVRKAFLQNANINMARMVIEGAVSPPNQQMRLEVQNHS